MSSPRPTTAASSGVRLDKKDLKAFNRRSDWPAIWFLAGNAVLFGAAGWLLHLSLGSWWVVPAMLFYGGIFATSTYALSHECAHGTAFRTRWINEVFFFLTSLVYVEEPYHRRYSHARHHTYTWHREMDSQMPWQTPLSFKNYLLENFSIAFYLYEFELLFRHALGRFGGDVLGFTPASELPKLKWGARAFLAIYVASALAIIWTGALWPLIYIVIPRLVGGVIMQLITFVQHAEMEENVLDIRRSTRTVTTNWLVHLFYWNMAYHSEHHLFPTVPFHALPQLNKKIQDQLPAPGRGLLRTNLEVLSTVLQRSFGKKQKLQSDTA